MDLAWFVYGINVVSGLNVAFGIATVIALLLWAMCSLIWAVNAGSGYDEYANGVFKVWKILAWFAVPITVASCFIPGEKTMYTMVGAYAAEQVAKDPKVQLKKIHLCYSRNELGAEWIKLTLERN